MQGGEREHRSREPPRLATPKDARGKKRVIKAETVQQFRTSWQFSTGCATRSPAIQGCWRTRRRETLHSLNNAASLALQRSSSTTRSNAAKTSLQRRQRRVLSVWRDYEAEVRPSCCRRRPDWAAHETYAARVQGIDDVRDRRGSKNLGVETERGGVNADTVGTAPLAGPPLRSASAIRIAVFALRKHLAAPRKNISVGD